MRELKLIKLKPLVIGGDRAIKLEVAYGNCIEVTIYSIQEINNILEEVKKILLEQPT